jgi:hypothetical protein
LEEKEQIENKKLANETMYTVRYVWQILSGSHLKWIALITMILDHTAMILIDSSRYYPAYAVMRSIGRIAFPLYCFLLIEGFYHTHCFWKYALSLGIFAVISEIPYNLVKASVLFYPQKQNIFFTLLFGLLMIKLMQMKKDDPIWRLIFLMGFCGVAQLTHMDYGMFGIIQIASFYFCRENALVRTFLIVLLNFCQGGIQSFGAVAVIPIECYNGTRGRQLKYFFYAAYPVHLLILYLLRWRLGYGG